MLPLHRAAEDALIEVYNQVWLCARDYKASCATPHAWLFVSRVRSRLRAIVETQPPLLLTQQTEINTQTPHWINFPRFSVTLSN